MAQQLEESFLADLEYADELAEGQLGLEGVDAPKARLTGLAKPLL